MGSVTYEGSIPEDDPRYKEGFTIKGPDKCLEEIVSAEDQKLIDYLPESIREHELIGKWLNLMQKREKVSFPVLMNLPIICQVILSWIVQ